MRLASRLLLAALLTVASSCILLLDFSEEGLACDPDGRCLEGYVCNANHQCMPEGHESTLCEGCGPLETCFKAKCVPVCDGRACPAGQACNEGVCVPSPAAALGAGCQSNDDCADPGVCLLPYGGGRGVCTKPCQSNLDCSNAAPECVTYDNGGNGMRICANPSFKPCSAEADCVDSGLSCGVYALEFGPIIDAVMACRTRNEGTNVVSVGQECSPALPCANGICVRADASGKSFCTAACSQNGDCEGLFNGQGHVCSNVVISGLGFPRTRPKLCVPNGHSTLLDCSSPATCRADAPYCKVTDKGTRCVPACSDSRPVCSLGVPAECQEIGGDQVCVQTN